MAELSPVNKRKEKKRKREQEHSTEEAWEVKRHKEMDNNKIEEDVHEVNTKGNTVTYGLWQYLNWLI